RDDPFDTCYRGHMMRAESRHSCVESKRRRWVAYSRRPRVSDHRMVCNRHQALIGHHLPFSERANRPLERLHWSVI
ncbi:MAG: hypothetical protein QOI02_1795, partial [Actinomycetota bacterium]|nr:hypothetical protein [Actinomycetota bacterium]